jgi:hypothetical protein
VLIARPFTVVAFALLLAKVPTTLDVLAAVRLLRPELIMSPATNSQVLRLVAPAPSTRLGMIELEEGACLAATTVGRNVRASQSVALEHPASRLVRDTAGIWPSDTGLAGWSFGSCKALSFEIAKQEIDGALDHHTEVTARVRVTQEIAAKLEFVAKLGARREFHLEPLL